MRGGRTHHEENAVFVGGGPGGPLHSFSRPIPGALRGQGRELLSCSSSAADAASRIHPDRPYGAYFLSRQAMEILFLLFVVAMFIGPLLYIGTLVGLIVTLVRVVKEIRERRLGRPGP